jgi:exonuclease III
MKIATYNVNSIRQRLPLVLEWITRHKPDVMCLQETKVQDQDFPAEAIRNAGYHPMACRPPFHRIPNRPYPVSPQLWRKPDRVH